MSAQRVRSACAPARRERPHAWLGRSAPCLTLGLAPVFPVLPLAAPALLSVTLFAFTNAWNEFLFAFVFITSENLKTLPVGLQLLVFGDIYPWGQLMAASLLMAIPVVIVYIYAQRYLVEGLTAGSIKG